MRKLESQNCAHGSTDVEPVDMRVDYGLPSMRPKSLPWHSHCACEADQRLSAGLDTCGEAMCRNTRNARLAWGIVATADGEGQGGCSAAEKAGREEDEAD